ncbi:hypothetical protein RIF29_04089 [Crotalaria pallida]|uniref:Uncharacterized protein n=1 Tax=Crotalaria pallida TaxID=3830 RepID=A0AAN9P9V2_CROPI
MAFQTSPLVFKVRRHSPELVAPAKPTPRELKVLSDLDSQAGTRFHISLVFFYPSSSSSVGGKKDPVAVIREALAKTLVFYYPFAGRVRESSNGKLMVDCTGEGVIFVGADADVTLDQFGKDLHPPFPCFEELLYNVDGSDGIIDCPLILIQVTRVICGGFIFAIHFNHTMCDATGISLFLKGLGEIACGASNPSVLPVWHRELLCARDPPRVTFIHHEYQQLSLENKSTPIPHHRSFFFGPKEIAAIRSLLPYHLANKSTSIEVLTAFLWRCRTIALQWKNPNQEVYLLGIVNARYGQCSFNPPLPDGYYGNAFVSPAAITTVGKLCSQPLGYALELVKKAKNEANEEYVHSVTDLMVINERRPRLVSFGEGSLAVLEVSDLTKAGYKDVNFGWGKALYAGVPESYILTIFCVPYTNSKGEQGRLAVCCLPEEVMERFAEELDNLIKIKNESKIFMSNL